jgi:hypothetical protein
MCERIGLSALLETGEELSSCERSFSLMAATAIVIACSSSSTVLARSPSTNGTPTMTHIFVYEKAQARKFYAR